MTSRKNEIKKQVIGEDADLEKSGRMLNRVIKWSRDGITIEADQRHVREMLLKDLEWEQANHAAIPLRTMQDVMQAREKTDENRNSAKPNTIGMMRVMVTTRTECT